MSSTGTVIVSVPNVSRLSLVIKSIFLIDKAKTPIPVPNKTSAAIKVITNTFTLTFLDIIKNIHKSKNNTPITVAETNDRVLPINKECVGM